MTRAGVVGFPAKHSLSPHLHRAWLQAAGIDGAYDIYEVAPDDFAAFVRGDHGLAGLNVTIPYKETALGLADIASDRARAAGAANILVFRDGVIHADNTDGLGLLAAFAEDAPAWSVKDGPVTVLGAGGAAKGAVAALLQAGAPKVRLANRTRARAEAIAKGMAGIGEGVVEVFDWDDLEAALDGANALVNATSLGLVGHDPLDIRLTGLKPGAPVMDMVYRPLKTGLLAQAEDSGHLAIDGLGMLIGQARPAFEAFFGATPDAGVDARALTLKAFGL